MLPLCRTVLLNVFNTHSYKNACVGGDWGTVNADGMIQLPTTLPLTGACLGERGVFLVDNGRVLMLWLGRMVYRAWSMEVGVLLSHVVSSAARVLCCLHQWLWHMFLPSSGVQ